MSSWEALSHMLVATESWFAMLSGRAVKGSYGNLKKFGDDALAIEHAYQKLLAAAALAPSKCGFGSTGLHMSFEHAMTESIRSTSIYRFDLQRSTAILRFPTSHPPTFPLPTGVGGRWATVTGKFDSIDSIFDPIRCRCLRLVGWACLKTVLSSSASMVHMDVSLDIAENYLGPKSR